MVFNYVKNLFGADPEIFLKRNGKVIGSERLIPKEGWKVGCGEIVRDGVQVELHPNTAACRQSFGHYMASLIGTLEAYAAKEGIEVCYDGTVEIDPEELVSLSSDSQMFHCTESFNAYGKSGRCVDARTYYKRFGGGHIHFTLQWPIYGKNPYTPNSQSLIDNRERLVRVLDAVYGNVSVILDQGTQQAERRLYYGLAGEYRKPSYGMEYRTPSNYWLRCYPLMSLSFSLARLAVGIMQTTTMGESGQWGISNASVYNLEGLLFECMNLQQVEQAINEGDVELAWKNFAGFELFLKGMKNSGIEEHHDMHGLREFLEVYSEKGINRIFPDSPKTAWEKVKSRLYNAIDGDGWESYSQSRKWRKVS